MSFTTTAVLGNEPRSLAVSSNPPPGSMRSWPRSTSTDAQQGEHRRVSVWSLPKRHRRRTVVRIVDTSQLIRQPTYANRLITRSDNRTTAGQLLSTAVDGR